MKKQDYLAATNLAKARIAHAVVSDMLLTDGDDVEKRNMVLSALYDLVGKLEGQACITPDGD